MQLSDVFVRPKYARNGCLRFAMAASAVFFGATLAHATSLGLTINATFDPSLTTAEQGAINSAISTLEANVTSAHNLAVSIYFMASSSISLGESITSIDTPSYYDFYNDLKAVATSTDQLTALTFLGPAPTSSSSSSPVPGTGATMFITTAEARNVGMTGFGTTPGVTVNSVNYDGEILLNTTQTNPPNTLNSSTYGLQSVAAHEIDEVLGIGGTGTTVGSTGNSGETGDLDLFRYSAAGTRSHSTSASASYFSIDGGATALTFFNQTSGGDYGDWRGIAADGDPVQVQNAFGTTNTNPVLGTNEIKALNVIGYQTVTAPEPSTWALGFLGLLGFGLVRRKMVSKKVTS